MSLAQAKKRQNAGKLTAKKQKSRKPTRLARKFVITNKEGWYRP